MNVKSKAERDRRRMWWLDFEDPGPLFDYIDELEGMVVAADREREKRDLAVAEAVREACAKEAEEHATYKCEDSEAGSELARILNKAVGEAVKTIRALDLRRIVEGVK